uniref:Double zinc ribbon and ankyrin repeat-containing protein 1 n=1 Tax=Phasianus colchicus TaxID=9054 RepID=A0A669P7F9_PHACC
MTAGSVSVPQVIPLRIPLPGKAKHRIDTGTRVEIKSDTPEVSIYYTLDGSKPELFRKPGYGEHNTFKYKSPITLPVGKITVKALAVTKDCRESAVVTKVFLVEYKQPNILFSMEDDDKKFLKDVTTQASFINCNLLSEYRKASTLQSSSLFSLLQKTLGNGLVSHRRLEPQLTNQWPKPRHKWFQIFHCYAPGHHQNKISHLAVVFRCAYCSAPRLSDPLAHFCQECGSPIPPVPVHRFPSPEGAEMAPCLECKHLVPMNTPACIVCESPVDPQLQPQTNTCFKGKVICQACGTGNPLHHKQCVTCESKLPETQMPMLGRDPPPPYTSQQGKTVFCSKCNRVNHCEARFCDWCGAKPDPPPCYFTCFKCGTKTRPYARFCGSCGVYIEPPSSHLIILLFLPLHLLQAKSLQAQIAWQPLPISLSKSRTELKETEDKGTQTVGLFYPSSKLLEKKELELVLHKEKLQKMSDHKPLLTAISPGKGYWRKQLDHVCAHLRSYAQNNLEFRALVGEPRMGKVGVISSNPKHHEKIILFPVFPQPESKQLMDELGPNGKGRITLIEQLLSEGADPNCTNNEDRPALTVAVLNGHAEVISLLVQKGADIDQQSGLHNNTALHEAVLLGLEGEKCIRALLRCNASIKKKNTKGQSAYDLAVTAGSNEIISLFASELGQGVLDSLTKPRDIGLVSI